MNVKNMSYLSLIKEINNLDINSLFNLPKSLSDDEMNLIVLGYELYHEDFNEDSWYRIITDILEIDIEALDYFLSEIDLAIILKIQPDNFNRLLSLIKEGKVQLFRSSITSDKLITVNHLSKYTKPNVNTLLDYINKN